jgi:ABC-type polar amino acid transport system ATPase subunit
MPAEADGEPVIRVEDLSYVFGAGANCRQVLDRVSMSVNESEIVLLTGPSGSGKTTLLTLIGTLRRAQQGSIRVLGRELVSATPRELLASRSRIRFVFQRHNLIECLTVLENVLSGLALLAGWRCCRSRGRNGTGLGRSTRSGSAIVSTPIPTSCRAASSSASRWRARSSACRTC